MAVSNLKNNISIIDSGITDGWAWRKYSDGVAECWIKLFDSTSSTQHTFSKNLPFTFAEAPVILSSGGNTANIDSGTRNTDGNETAVGAYVTATWSNSAWCYLYVIGKWR